MSQFLKRFEIRWNDLDPNRHVANSTFSAFMNDTRMSFLTAKGFNQQSFAKHNMGPVIFSEEFYYQKEIHPAETVHVDIELLAATDDFKFVKFCHSLFNGKNDLAVYSEIYFGWFDLASRRLTSPPDELKKILESLPKSERFTRMEKDSLKMNHKVPVGKKLQQV